MLADKRRKQKWTLNPRGTLWSSDSSKFGQRLLEKMGWKAGCGLGANLQGPTEHIRVSVKNDNRGVGFKGRAEDQLEHQNSFSKLLDELNGGVKEEVKVSSLEQLSQKSRARVHYQKFTRGKDLSRCSDKDLQCILGKNMVESDEAEQENFAELGVNDSSFGVLTVNGGNCDEYFKKKLSNKFEPEGEKNIDGCTEVDKQRSKKKKSKRNKNVDNLHKISECDLSVGESYEAKECGRKFDVVEECVSKPEESREELGAFIIKGINKKDECATDILVDVMDSEKVKLKERHKLDRRKDKKRKVSEANSSNEFQDGMGKVKKKRRKDKVCDLSVFLEDSVPPLSKFEENCDHEVLSDKCDKVLGVDELVLFGEPGVVKHKKKKKSKKEKKEILEKDTEIHNEFKLENEEISQEKLRTGIMKGMAVTDGGFKGSNLLCIKGYGI